MKIFQFTGKGKLNLPMLKSQPIREMRIAERATTKGRKRKAYLVTARTLDERFLSYLLLIYSHVLSHRATLCVQGLRSACNLSPPSPSRCIRAAFETWRDARPVPSHPVPSRPVPSVPSRPVPSRPVPSRPVPSAGASRYNAGSSGILAKPRYKILLKLSPAWDLKAATKQWLLPSLSKKIIWRAIVGFLGKTHYPVNAIFSLKKVRIFLRSRLNLLSYFLSCFLQICFLSFLQIACFEIKEILS